MTGTIILLVVTSVCVMLGTPFAVISEKKDWGTKSEFMTFTLVNGLWLIATIIYVIVNS